MRARRPSRLAVIPVVIGLVALAAPAFAHPPTPVDGKGRAIGGVMHKWLHQAKVPLPKGRVQIIRGRCPGHPNYDACVITRRPRRIYMAVQLSHPRRLLYHELGHVFDLRVLNDRERRGFKKIMGIRRKGWFRGGMPPAEAFADGYQRCAYRTRILAREAPSPYGFRPSVRQHRRICLLISRAAAPRGRPPQPPKNPPAVVNETSPPPAERVPGPPCDVLDVLLTDCSPSGVLGSPLL
jgi:hypothetical protein